MHKGYDRYDYEEAYKADISKMSDADIERMLRSEKVKSAYLTKTIKHGMRITSYTFPSFARKADVPHCRIRKESSAAQKKLNDRRSMDRMEQILNTNFSSDDIWMTLEYDKEHLPETIEDALRCVQNYIRNVNRRLKKAGFPSLKYLYVTEYDDPQTGKQKRVHHHMICSCDLGRDVMEEMWKNGSRTKSEYLDPREEGWLKGLSNYMAKGNYSRKTGQRRWNCSKGLKHPEVTRSYSRFSKKAVTQMVEDEDTARRLAEKSYKDVIVLDVARYWNEQNRSYYIRIEMIRKDWKKQYDEDKRKRPGVSRPKKGGKGGKAGADGQNRHRRRIAGQDPGPRRRGA